MMITSLPMVCGDSFALQPDSLLSSADAYGEDRKPGRACRDMVHDGSPVEDHDTRGGNS